MEAGDSAGATLTHRWVAGGSPAERDFLRDALVRHGRGEPVALPAAAPWGEDAEAFLALVERERVGPLLHRAVGANGDLPARIRDALRRFYRLAGLRNLLFLRALEQCLAALAAADVAVIVLKGAALAEPVYGNVALRPMADVDLLVRRADVAATSRILGELGYAPLRAETRSGALSEYENEMTFWRQEMIRIDLDLHWSLIDSPFYQEQLAMEWFWSTARVQNLGRVRALTLGREAQLLHLCAHLMLHHGGSGLIWWNDIAAVLLTEGEALDWEVVIARARAYRLLLPLREVLGALASEWGAPVPAAILGRLAGEEPSRRETDLFARLSGGESAGQRLWTDLRSIPGWRQRLRFAAANLFPSPDYMRRRYALRHGSLLPVYYPYRWWRGCRDLWAGSSRGRDTRDSAESGDPPRRGA